MTLPLFTNDLDELNLILRNRAGEASRVLFVADSNTVEKCLPLLKPESVHQSVDIIPLPAGEKFKQPETCLAIWKKLSELKADRDTLLVNVGGGVVTDMGGFAAATYNRGIRFIHIPTSLMAMADAAIGGKNGVDLGELKNVIGTIIQPYTIIICDGFLRTLPKTELLSGFAEMMKHGLVNDRNHFHELGALDTDLTGVEKHIMTSVSIKYRIVSDDPTDLGGRKLLNFGHTFGHAIESVFLEKQNPVPHGIAIAMGMMAETNLSVIKGMLSAEDATAVLRVMCKFFGTELLKTTSFESVLGYMQSDKKKKSGKLLFTLLQEIGRGVINVHCTPDECLAAFERTVV